MSTTANTTKKQKAKRVSIVEKQTRVKSIRMAATLAVVKGATVSGTIVPLKDLSATGVAIYTKLPLDPHTQIRLSIEDVKHDPIEGRVVWCSPIGNDHLAPVSHSYRVGIEFTPPNETKRQLYALVFEQVSKLVESW